MKLGLFTVLAFVGSLAAQEPVPASTPADLSKTGFLFSGTPDSLTVAIDDSVRGVTPLKVTGIAEGEHVVVFTKKGYYGKKLTATAVKDVVTPVSAELRAPASLTVISSPDSAIIFLNRKKIDKTPFTISPLRPESYSVMLLKAGYNQLDTNVTLESGKSDTLNLSLVSQESSVPVVAKPVVADTSKGSDVAPVGNSTQSESVVAEKKKKMRFTVIASALFTAFLTTLFISEFRNNES